MKIAIVGAEEDKWKLEQKEQAKNIVETLLAKHAFRETIKELPYSSTSMEIDWSKIVLVSGGCPEGGVDIWAEEIADKLGISKEIYKPEVNQWDDEVHKIPFNKDEVEKHNIDISGLKFDGYYYYQVYKRKGYKSRNIQIAEACDVLYCIVPHVPLAKCKHCGEKGHPSNGGCWTMKYAKKLGKEVYRVIIE